MFLFDIYEKYHIIFSIMYGKSQTRKCLSYYAGHSLTPCDFVLTPHASITELVIRNILKKICVCLFEKIWALPNTFICFVARTISLSLYKRCRFQSSWLELVCHVLSVSGKLLLEVNALDIKMLSHIVMVATFQIGKTFFDRLEELLI